MNENGFDRFDDEGHSREMSKVDFDLYSEHDELPEKTWSEGNLSHFEGELTL